MMPAACNRDGSLGAIFVGMGDGQNISHINGIRYKPGFDPDISGPADQIPVRWKADFVK